MKPAASTALLLALVLTLAGCSTTPPSCEPFRAAWYLGPDTDASGSTAPALYLALLNEGQGQMAVEHLAVNPDIGSQPAFEKAYSESLRPGDLRLFHLNRELPPSSIQCWLPVAVTLTCTRGELKGKRTEAVSGALPNYLHAYWLDKCMLPKKANPS
ncbi:hypothetical protein GT347_05970 [Xylophilus rhododendri]|uniref:Lipoprotein n=1 Tax=Xylophilus rhododendri TaxID=2697032 RepID=A0A857J2V3_9BURK|nr:hypothetical protein [Xylophilus rhododendri]QHI97573.1 hypothetical protein GT347_05970 [Xylophilus rhododendri]